MLCRWRHYRPPLPVAQLEVELSQQREQEAKLKEALSSTVKERELLSWAIEDSRVAAQAEAEARARVEQELERQVCATTRHVPAASQYRMPGADAGCRVLGGGGWEG